MTVLELIEALAKMPVEMEVVVRTWDAYTDSPDFNDPSPPEIKSTRDLTDPVFLDPGPIKDVVVI